MTRRKYRLPPPRYGSKLQGGVQDNLRRLDNIRFGRATYANGAKITFGQSLGLLKWLGEVFWDYTRPAYFRKYRTR